MAYQAKVAALKPGALIRFGGSPVTCEVRGYSQRGTLTVRYPD